MKKKKVEMVVVVVERRICRLRRWGGGLVWVEGPWR